MNDIQISRFQTKKQYERNVRQRRSLPQNYIAGETDPVSGLMKLIEPDGSITLNAEKIFNTLQPGESVQVTKAYSSGIVQAQSLTWNADAAAPTESDNGIPIVVAKPKKDPQGDATQISTVDASWQLATGGSSLGGLVYRKKIKRPKFDLQFEYKQIVGPTTFRADGISIAYAPSNTINGSGGDLGVADGVGDGFFVSIDAFDNWLVNFYFNSPGVPRPPYYSGPQYPTYAAPNYNLEFPRLQIRNVVTDWKDGFPLADSGKNTSLFSSSWQSMRVTLRGNKVTAIANGVEISYTFPTKIPGGYYLKICGATGGEHDTYQFRKAKLRLT